MPENSQLAGLPRVNVVGVGVQEPRRLSKRYLYNNPRLLLKMTSQILGLSKYEPVYRFCEAIAGELDLSRQCGKHLSDIRA